MPDNLEGSCYHIYHIRFPNKDLEICDKETLARVEKGLTAFHALGHGLVAPCEISVLGIPHPSGGVLDVDIRGNSINLLERGEHEDGFVRLRADPSAVGVDLFGCYVYRIQHSAECTVAVLVGSPAQEDEERSDNDLRERALEDMKTATETIRNDLSEALGAPAGASWQDLTSLVKELKTQEQAPASERDTLMLAMTTLRDQVVEADNLVRAALGYEPGEGKCPYGFADNVRRLIGCMEENATDHEQALSAWEAKKASLEAKVNYLESTLEKLREGDAGQAFDWKAHFVNLASAVGVPRSVVGDVKSPQVDAVMNYVAQTIPGYKLAITVRKLEKRVAELEAREPEPKPPSATTHYEVCKHCHVRVPAGVQFCPRCGEAEFTPGMNSEEDR